MNKLYGLLLVFVFGLFFFFLFLIGGATEEEKYDNELSEQFKYCYAEDEVRPQ